MILSVTGNGITTNNQSWAPVVTVVVMNLSRASVENKVMEKKQPTMMVVNSVARSVIDFYNEDMKIKALVFFGLLLCVLPVFAGGGRDADVKRIPDYTGTVQYLEGHVSMNGKAMEIGDTVSPGATITTADASYCEIVFGGKNIFRIMEDTVAEIRLEQGEGNIGLKKGSMAFLLTRLSVLAVEKPEFLVETPSAAFGVRGTAFFVAVENPASTYVCACNGELQVEDFAGANSQKLTGLRHKALRIAADASGGYQVSSPGLLYHDDDDMNSLAYRIDETIPWGRSGY